MLLLQKFGDVDTHDVSFVTKVIYLISGNGMTLLSVIGSVERGVDKRNITVVRD